MSTHSEIQFVFLDDIAKKSRLVASKTGGLMALSDSGVAEGFSIFKIVTNHEDSELLTRIRNMDADRGVFY